MNRRLLLLVSIGVVIAVVIIIVALKTGPAPQPVTSSEAKSGKYQESPMLRDRVERGELPPVEERLPDNPLVVTPIESVGRYDSELKDGESP